MRSRWLCVLLVGSSLTCPALADQVQGARSEQMLEQAHEALITLEPGAATMRVRRTLHNGGERHDQATFWIDVPDGAVAVGLRTKGTLAGKPHWFSGELMEAERAARMYEELTGIGGYYPKDPALLSWRSASLLALQVFPVAPNSSKQVEYTYRLPVTYSGGRYRVSVGLTQEPSPVAVSARAPGGHRLLAHGNAVRDGGTVEPVAGQLTLELAPRDMHELRVRLGSAPTGERHLIHFEAQAPPRLSEVPPSLHAVIMIDTSRSRDGTEVEASLALAQAYLGHLLETRLRAQVQVIEFDHQARARHPAFVSAAEASVDLDAHGAGLANGSDLEGALALAAQWLARAPDAAPRRLLLLSDMRMPSRSTPERALALTAPTHALVHAAYVAHGEPLLTRPDGDHPWSRFASASGGVLWDALAQRATEGDRVSAHSVFEHLVRPVRLEQVRVLAPGAPEELSEMWTELDEGEELRVDVLGSQAVPNVSVEGLLWSQPVRVAAGADEAEATRAAALVFGSELHEALSEAEMMTLALRGQVVSPVTSYLAIEPGVRPSTEGLDRGEGGLGLGGSGTIGCGWGGASADRAGRFDAQAYFEHAISERWQACGGELVAATLVLETTGVEIADILPGSLAGAEPGLAACMSELVWRLELPHEFQAFERRTWVFELAGA
jgi:hypothetical protein